LSIYPHMTFSFVKENHIFSEIWLANDLKSNLLFLLSSVVQVHVVFSCLYGAAFCYGENSRHFGVVNTATSRLAYPDI